MHGESNRKVLYTTFYPGGNERCNIVVDDKYRPLNVADRHLAYREAGQKYSKEEPRIWEDLRHGILLGTKKNV